MTDKNFAGNPKALIGANDLRLVMIVSFNPITGKSIWDYYDYDGTDFWLNSIKKAHGLLKA